MCERKMEILKTGEYYLGMSSDILQFLAASRDVFRPIAREKEDLLVIYPDPSSSCIGLELHC